MEPLFRVTVPTLDVLDVLLASDEPLWGLQIINQTSRPSGTIYPILERLERQGWVVSTWEADGERPGPRRRFYEYTSDGRSAAIGLRSAGAPVRPIPRPSRRAVTS
jgi:PadR family transcriptional regulator PadR